jgi:hypothetical protein
MSIDLTLVNKTTAFIAKRNSGKSCLLKYLVEHEKHCFDKIFVICPTESINRFYKDIVDENCLFDSYQESWTEQLISSLTKINADTKPEERKKVLLIYDDILSDIDFHQSPAIKKIFTRGRHVGLSIICTCQYLYQLPPICRSNCDYVLVGQMNNQSKNLLCDEFLAGSLDRKQFIDLYNKCTRDYNFLIINNNSIKDNDDIDQIYGVIRAKI